jgi:hypothetical protein
MLEQQSHSDEECLSEMKAVVLPRYGGPDALELSDNDVVGATTARRTSPATPDLRT